MFDPAALGTLRIGLDALDAEGRQRRSATRLTTGRQLTTDLRLRAAATLRRVADLLESGPFREVPT